MHARMFGRAVDNGRWGASSAADALRGVAMFSHEFPTWSYVEVDGLAMTIEGE